jgi:hypothetical protein
MERGKWTAIVVAATLAGIADAEVRDYFAPPDQVVDISQDAGPIGGTAIYQVAELGFVDARLAHADRGPAGRVGHLSRRRGHARGVRPLI